MNRVMIVIWNILWYTKIPHIHIMTMFILILHVLQLLRPSDITLAVGSDATMADGSTTATKITLTSVGVYVTPKSDAKVTAYKNVSFCGATDWTKDVEKDFTSKVTTVYKDVSKLKGTDLWWGEMA